MIRSLWVEAVIAPPLKWADGRALEPCTPFEVTQPITFEPRDSEADVRWPADHRLVITPGPDGVFFEEGRDQDSKRRWLVRAGVPYTGRCTMRVLSSPKESAGWPLAIARPRGPWSDEMVQVIADQLHELGLSVGQRFISREEVTDLHWLPIRHPQVTWRRGLVDTLRCWGEGGWQFGRALGLLAVCMPLRELTISCREPTQPRSILEGMIPSGGLPCLESLVFDVHQPELSPASALRELIGFAEAFPTIRTVEVMNSRPLGAIG